MKTFFKKRRKVNSPIFNTLVSVGNSSKILIASMYIIHNM